MATIVGVRIKNSGKLFYFDPVNAWPKPGDKVIVETSRGMIMGEIVLGVKKILDSDIKIPLKPIIRIATQEDIEHQREIDIFAKEAFEQCKAKIVEHNLNMKLAGAEPMFDNTKIMFYFTANQRVDFRDLVKDLAAMFKMRIELRQIGVRDEAKMLGTLGVCGKPLCCAKFLGDFQPVSIKMAKEQNLSLNPAKISGTCGRLMCCLKYEQDYYEKMYKIMPKQGKGIETPDGVGVVCDVNAIRERVTVKIDKAGIIEMKTFTLDQLKNPEKYKKENQESKPSEFDAFIKAAKEDKQRSNENINNKNGFAKTQKQENKNFNTKRRSSNNDPKDDKPSENIKTKTFADMKKMQNVELDNKQIKKINFKVNADKVHNKHKDFKPKKPFVNKNKQKTNWQKDVEKAINKNNN